MAQKENTNALRLVRRDVSVFIQSRDSAILQATVPTERLTSLNLDLRPLFTDARNLHRLNEQVELSTTRLQSHLQALTIALQQLATEA